MRGVTHLKFSIFYCMLLYVCTAFSEIVINEIHYEPEDKTALLEFIELINTSNAPVDVSATMVCRYNAGKTNEI